MNCDIELIRHILLGLEGVQRSPPEPLILDVAAIAQRYGASEGAASVALDFLLGAAVIEGAGFLDKDRFVFRKVTPKGRSIVAALEAPAHWDAIKAAYRSEAVEPEFGLSERNGR